MKRFIVAALAIAAFAGVSTAGTANAATAWPARCQNFKCVNAHLNALHTQQVTLKKNLAKLNWVNPCLNTVVPITQFGGFFSDDGAGGTIEVTGLDYTLSGDVPDAWLLAVDPSCAPATAKTTVGTYGGHTLRVAAHFARHR